MEEGADEDLDLDLMASSSNWVRAFVLRLVGAT